jgi:hypothetical protein
MSTASDSSMDLRFEPLVAGGAEGAVGPVGDGQLWLDGGVLSCACPDCGAPMSIRLWLLVADCWRCGASFELTEDQEREAYRLLREHEHARKVELREAVEAIEPVVERRTAPSKGPSARRDMPLPAAPPPAAPSPAAAPVEAPADEPAPRVAARRVPAAQVHRSAQARVRQLKQRAGVRGLLGALFDETPAWFVSAVIHALALILAGMWFTSAEPDRYDIILATSISPQEIEGEQGKLNDDETAPEFDMPGAVEFKSAFEEIGMTEEPKPEMPRPDPPLEIPNPVGRLPVVDRHVMLPQEPLPVGKMFAGRDPTLRAQMVRQSGGSSYTEVAVARGLKFLARHQQRDGSWSFRRFNKMEGCDETCNGEGHSDSDVAATALALLPFMGAGQTHLEGQYTREVLDGLNYLCAQQQEDGDLRGRGDGRMYAHGMASIALCEAFALTGDEQLRAPAQQAIDFIVAAQHRAGGWRYEPREAGDTSVVGWQLMALKSGQMAHLHVPAQTFERCGLYLDRAQVDKVGARYGYQPGHRDTPAMTAESLLCRQYLGWPKDHPGLKTGVDSLLADHLPDADRPNIYYWYYATQVMHHFGGSHWETWNEQMRKVLVESQETQGHAAGSWAPRGRGNDGGFADRGGRIYMTALVLCTLEVYYRHLPLYGSDVVEGLEGF